MKTLKGSCHCGKVKFEVKSNQYYPYQACYCSICRKTQGGGGFAINLSADARTMKVRGEKFVKKYNASKGTDRCFCGVCGSALWIFSKEWPDLLHPFASAIDTKLPAAPDRTHMMLKFKAPWVVVCASGRDKKFQKYPKESIEQWHKRHRLI